jgi:ubiquinone/menaquinone biosynthesis C-methylase UbiE
LQRLHIKPIFSSTPLGDQKNGIRCENLEQLTFPDETFDIFITQDVFEHIFDIEKASNEIMRVLKAPGIHIFTAPKHKELKKTIPRAESINGQITKTCRPPLICSLINS